MVSKSPIVSERMLDNDHLYFKKGSKTYLLPLICTVKSNQPIFNLSISLIVPSNLYNISGEKKMVSAQGTEKFEFLLACSCEQYPYSNKIEAVLKFQNNDASTYILMQTKVAR